MSLLFLLATSPAFAYSAGKTGSTTSGCGACHGATASASTTATFGATVATAEPGEVLVLTMRIANSGSATSGAGLDVAASGGTLVAGSNTRVTGGEVTHSATTAMSGGAVTFNFSWRAPTAEGTYTVRGAGNAVNGDRASSGDAWALASNLTLTVDDGCDDLDGDGYEGCDDGTGADCDDGDAAIAPNASETCDGVDEDCDGTTDESPVDGTPYWPDADEDGWGADGASVRSCTALAGYVTIDGDCDDGQAAIRPDADETCDGVDEDCDGAVDGPGAIDAVSFFRDADGDGYGDAAVATPECVAPLGYAADATDCDDTRGAVHPDAAEVCDALDLDEDCDGLSDDADADVTGTSRWYLDSDADGYGAATTADTCVVPSGYTAVPGDCDDGSSAFNPGATESCDDPTDYNCDGSTGFGDGDGDGFVACLDCDDGDAAVSPSGTEACNDIDDDCDGTVDEPDAVDALTWYVDADGDGWGGTETTLACADPEGYVATASDCDDGDASVRPDAAEAWYDDVDQDCDGNDDDQDRDGFPADTDCDDRAAATFPGASDAWYDGVDSDCAGNSDYDGDADGQDSASHGGEDCDDARDDIYLGAPDTPYDGVVTDCVEADEYDVDGDGFALEDDCDDANSAIRPGAEEVWYDGVDQDCDGNDDDQDGDGVAADLDCDDEDAGVTTCDTGDTAVDTDVPDEDTGSATDDGDGGCGCDTTGTGSAALALLGLAAVARRRRA
jgi:MYXO-CTERM domain-containing protein